MRLRTDRRNPLNIRTVIGWLDEARDQERKRMAAERDRLARRIATLEDQLENAVYVRTCLEARATDRDALRDAARRLIAADMAGELLAPYLAALEDLTGGQQHGS